MARKFAACLLLRCLYCVCSVLGEVKPLSLLETAGKRSAHPAVRAAQAQLDAQEARKRKSYL